MSKRKPLTWSGPLFLNLRVQRYDVVVILGQEVATGTLGNEVQVVAATFQVANEIDENVGTLRFAFSVL